MAEVARSNENNTETTRSARIRENLTSGKLDRGSKFVKAMSIALLVGMKDERARIPSPWGSEIIRNYSIERVSIRLYSVTTSPFAYGRYA